MRQIMTITAALFVVATAAQAEAVFPTAVSDKYADEKPDKAGIDPLLLLIDRVPDDNMIEVTIQP